MPIDLVIISKVTWLLFMLGDLPRLLFRAWKASKHNMFSTDHRIKNYSITRIVGQQLLQNITYLIALFLLYIYCQDSGFFILFLLAVFLNACRIKYQLSIKTPYVITPKGHFINDVIMKPFRLIVIAFIFFKLKQYAWLMGFSVLFSKWLLISFYDREFDVPRLFHILLIISSVILVLSIYPIQVLGIVPISIDALRSVFSTIPAVYTAFVGFLGVLYTIILSENKEDGTLRQYVTKGILLNFSFTSLLTILSFVAMLVFSSHGISLNSESLFKTQISITKELFVVNLLFGIILSLGWFVFLFILMTTYVMFRYTGNYSNQLNPENPLLAKILAMKLDGKSSEEIAKELNIEGVPVTGPKKWTKNDVNNLIQKAQ